MKLTHQRLLEVLHYDPETGVFVWLERRRGRQLGHPVGSHTNTGYLSIRIDGKLYLAHRLAWFYMTGQWPADRVDHKDCVGTNNRWLNLRACTQRQNSMNQRTPKNNNSGFKGVSFHKKNRTWLACICVNRKTVHLGTFQKIEDAVEAYRRAANEHHGEFARVA